MGEGGADWAAWAGAHEPTQPWWQQPHTTTNPASQPMLTRHVCVVAHVLQPERHLHLQQSGRTSWRNLATHQQP